MKSLQVKTSKLHENIDENEAYERRDCLVVSGAALPSFSTGEICSNLVTNMVTHYQAYINVSHQLGSKSTKKSTGKRPFIATLCRPDLKCDVLMPVVPCVLRFST